MGNRKNYIEIGARPKVIVAMALQDTMLSKTAISLVQALHNVQFDYDIIMSMGCDLIGSRTRLVRQAIALGGTHMLFIDHDMYFPPSRNVVTDKLENPIARLLSHGKDVVGVPYNFRSLPPRTTAIPADKAPVDGKFEIDPNDLPKELFKAQALGTGFLLIKLDVFEKIEKPWFNFGRDSNAELVYGEDTWFVHQCLKAGIDVWCDPLVKVGHLGVYQY